MYLSGELWRNWCSKHMSLYKNLQTSLYIVQTVTSLFDNYMSIGYDFLGASTYKACLVEFIGVVANYNGNAFDDKSVVQSRLLTNNTETKYQL